MSDLVKNPEDRFYHDTAHLICYTGAKESVLLNKLTQVRPVLSSPSTTVPHSELRRCGPHDSGPVGGVPSGVPWQPGNLAITEM